MKHFSVCCVTAVKEIFFHSAVLKVFRCNTFPPYFRKYPELLPVLMIAIGCFYSNLSADWYAQGNGGAVAAGRTEKSADAGIEILKAEGTAADAAVAVLLVLTAEDFGMFCMGGEVPLIHYEAATGEVKVLSGQGRAPLDPVAIQWLIDNGIPKAYTSNNIKSAAVPAVIDLCVTAMQQWGKLSFEEVAQPLLRILDNGTTSWYDELAATMRKLIQSEKDCSGTYVEKLQAVSDRFYRGDIADDLDAWYKSKGGFLTKEDLAAHVTNIEDPISIEYKGYTVYKCDTWTQGAFLLQSLRLLEGFNLTEMGHNSADYIHVITESMKLAFADRDEYYVDPEFADVPLDALLSDEYTELRRPLINMDRASDTIISGDPVNMLARNPNPHPMLKWPKGTTTCAVVDKWGNVVSCTPSGWGSQAGVGSTGVHHGTRLISSLSWDNHPNQIEPGKRPCITLTPTIVMKDNKPILAISVAGGDEQDQSALNLFLDFVEFGMAPKDAVSATRFTTAHRTSFFGQTIPKLASLIVSGSISSTINNTLKNRGHQLSISTSVKSNPVMIYIDQAERMYYAAGCPKSYRKCAAYDLIASSDPYHNLLKSQNLSIIPKQNMVEIRYFIADEKKLPHIAIFNAQGRLIKNLSSAQTMGEHILRWYVTDTHGNRIVPGCYIVILSFGDTMVSSNFVYSQSF